jgi:AraC-like DNA-binding protein
MRSGPVPRDVRRAIDHMRRNMGRKIAVSELAAVCDVAERTLRKHFRQFVGLSPLAFFRRLRLAAVREDLLDGSNCTTITEVATRYGFSHFGRFAQQYRRTFGEAPSSTFARGRATAGGRTMGRIGDEGWRGDASDTLGSVRSSRERPSLVVLQCDSSAAGIRPFAQCVAEGIAAALYRVRSICIRVPASSRVSANHDPQRLARELGARYVLTGRIAQGAPRIFGRIAATTRSVTRSCNPSRSLVSPS